VEDLRGGGIEGDGGRKKGYEGDDEGGGMKEANKTGETGQKGLGRGRGKRRGVGTQCRAWKGKVGMRRKAVEDSE